MIGFILILKIIGFGSQDYSLQKNYFFERAVNPFIFAKTSTKI